MAAVGVGGLREDMVEVVSVSVVEGRTEMRGRDGMGPDASCREGFDFSVS